MSSSTDSILLRLQAALDADGDFPTRAKVITEIKRLTEDPNTPVDRLVDVILSEPSLATRILHIVNSVYYDRGMPIETLSQAVVHLGLRSIYNLCANFVLMQRFTPLVKQGGAFYRTFLLSMAASNLASMLDGYGKNDKKEEEEGYLCGSLFTIGPVLLGYYFPKLFTDAAKRAERKRIGLYQSIEELLGVPAVGISLGVVDSLSIPAFYKDILMEAFTLYVQREAPSIITSERPSSRSVTTAMLISECILEEHDPLLLKKQIDDIAISFKYDIDFVFRNLSRIPFVLEQQAELLGLDSVDLPTAFIDLISEDKSRTVKSPDKSDSELHTLTPYLEQLEQAIRESETLASVIATVMEAITFALEFDRVVYMESDVDRTTLSGKLGLGNTVDNLEDIRRILPEDSYPEDLALKAYLSGSVETYGEPLFSEAWPFAAIPVGYGDRALGVIYADLNSTKENELDNLPLDTEKTVALSLLADILDRAIQKNRV
ncbi:MAG TPA: HDOD domain-containing protein [Oligoflexia bacterium]|nr:HDOD domain-containing protein [Oligoflexia bacterium]HMP47494.1 HDOD domain-containing protein [Oligoflexia bacterium]